MTERRRIGRYEVIDVVGRGGMAVVYLARQPELGRRVALKEMSAIDFAGSGLLDRFVAEARMVASLAHPNILTLHEAFEWEGRPIMAMEYAEGGSLRAHLRDLSIAQRFGVLESALAALTAADQREIVHRDLKPENLLVMADGQLKVADFGIARARTEMLRGVMTPTGQAIGTPTYMAPEQAMAQDVGPRTDLYAVGGIAYELFTGRPPFVANEPAALLLKHVSEQPADPRTINPQLDAPVAAWILRLLSKEPADRPASANAAWEELEDVVVDLLGPVWRRQARLPATTVQMTADPLPPALFVPQAHRHPTPPPLPTQIPANLAASAPTVRQCLACGSSLPAGSGFCPTCGASVRSPTPPAPLATPMIQPAPPAYVIAAPPTPAASPSGGGGMPAAFALVGIACVIAIGVVAALALTRGDEEPTTAAAPPAASAAATAPAAEIRTQTVRERTRTVTVAAETPRPAPTVVPAAASGSETEVTGSAGATFETGRSSSESYAAAYCSMTSARVYCWTPNDGYTLMLTNAGAERLREEEAGNKGRTPGSYGGIGFGASRQTNGFECTSRATGLTCVASSGRGFVLPRYRGLPRLF